MSISSPWPHTTVLQNVTIGENATKCSVDLSVLFLMTACGSATMSIKFRLKNQRENKIPTGK